MYGFHIVYKRRGNQIHLQIWENSKNSCQVFTILFCNHVSTKNNQNAPTPHLSYFHGGAGFQKGIAVWLSPECPGLKFSSPHECRYQITSMAKLKNNGPWARKGVPKVIFCGLIYFSLTLSVSASVVPTPYIFQLSSAQHIPIHLFSNKTAWESLFLNLSSCNKDEIKFDSTSFPLFVKINHSYFHPPQSKLNHAYYVVKYHAQTSQRTQRKHLNKRSIGDDDGYILDVTGLVQFMNLIL